MSNPFKKQTPMPVPTKSIEQQAEDARVNSVAKKIDIFAEKISKHIQAEMWKENFDVAVLTVVSEAIKKKTDNWFGAQINKKKMQDIIEGPRPPAESQK